MCLNMKAHDTDAYMRVDAVYKFLIPYFVSTTDCCNRNNLCFFMLNVAISSLSERFDISDFNKYSEQD